MRRFQTYRWPGNVRELRNTLESMMVLADGDVLTERDLPERIADASENLPSPEGDPHRPDDGGAREAGDHQGAGSVRRQPHPRRKPPGDLRPHAPAQAPAVRAGAGREAADRDRCADSRHDRLSLSPTAMTVLTHIVIAVSQLGNR